jgi:HD superfamily phosphohydrolase
MHDLGHGPFSHVFDNRFMPRAQPNSSYNHEEMSLRMLEYLVDENNIDMEKDDIRFIQKVIVGAKE